MLACLVSGAAPPWRAEAADFLNRARWSLAAGNLEEAERLARKEAALHPGQGQAWSLLGAIALQRGNQPEAEDALEHALRANPEDGEAASLLALLRRRQGRFREAASLLRSLGREAEASQLAAFGTAPPFRQRGPDEIRLSWVGSGWRPVIPALVDGKREADFLVDTGASCVVLDRRLADRIGLAAVGSARLLGAGARSTGGKLCRLPSLRLGGTEVRDIPVAVVDLRRAGKAEETFQGILGSEFLQHFVVTLDYPGRRLCLQKAGTSSPSAAGRLVADVPLRLTPGGLVVVPIEVASRERLLVFLDTGAAETALALSRRAAGRLGLTPLRRGERYFGVGGGYRASPILLRDLRFAGFSARNVPGLIAPFPAQIEEGEGIPLGGFLGSEFCRPFRVTIDFPRMRLLLALPERET
ncbi:aspartyl protease family protein [Methylacidimicrobium sp. AP8]|uniref:aspartyl protease family protein n=1 Tax=Methylacidimicrobium sp. AP8 TaxID=2730359 RepID=UPI0019214C82|nr:aspartyl protease family protein [Methylacidimicrobium sp. AP8]